MIPRVALLAMITAFGFSVAFATITTIRQVNSVHSALPQRAARL